MISMKQQRRSHALSLAALLLGMTACSSGAESTTTSAGRQPASSPAPAAAAMSQPASSPATSGAVAPALPTPTFVPTGEQPAGNNTPAVASAGGGTTRLDDTAWRGSYRRAGGNTVYGGRTATWIYGTMTEYSTMQATFNVTGQPMGTVELSVEGMDSEDTPKTLIRITVNGQSIFEGANPLPNDDQPLESGTWATYTWEFDSSLLRSGENVIAISNLAPGQFSRPPFFMLDYADVVYETQE